MRRDAQARRAKVLPAVLHALIGCAVLVGVLAMHALTVGHAPATLGAAVAHPHVMQTAPHLALDVQPVAIAAVEASHCMACDHDATSHHEVNHTSLGVCLAVVAGTLLVWLLAWRRRLPARLNLSLRRIALLPGALSPPWRTAPSLSSLCVLRT